MSELSEQRASCPVHADGNIIMQRLRDFFRRFPAGCRRPESRPGHGQDFQQPENSGTSPAGTTGRTADFGTRTCDGHRRTKTRTARKADGKYGVLFVRQRFFFRVRMPEMRLRHEADGEPRHGKHSLHMRQVRIHRHGLREKVIRLSALRLL